MMLFTVATVDAFGTLVLILVIEIRHRFLIRSDLRLDWDRNAVVAAADDLVQATIEVDSVLLLLWR